MGERGGGQAGCGWMAHPPMAGGRHGFDALMLVALVAGPRALA